MSEIYVPETQPVPCAATFEEPWAAWHLRVAAALVDAALALPFFVVSLILTSVVDDPESNVVIDLVCLLLSLANVIGYLGFSFWNQIIRQGRCGATLGKQCFGLLVLSKNNARPIGALLTFARYWAHVLDALPLMIGYLWPLVDKEKQTFADKIVNTAVLKLPGVRF